MQTTLSLKFYLWYKSTTHELKHVILDMLIHFRQYLQIVPIDFKFHFQVYCLYCILPIKGANVYVQGRGTCVSLTFRVLLFVVSFSNKVLQKEYSMQLEVRVTWMLRSESTSFDFHIHTSSSWGAIKNSIATIYFN